MNNQYKNSACHNCGEVCAVIKDVAVGMVSDCCGVGFDYEDSDGEISTVNEDLRYCNEWNN